MSKTVELRGQKWVVRIDPCRFYIRPAEGNPLLDREERACLEFKHDDGPASELADLLFTSLPVAESREVAMIDRDQKLLQFTLMTLAVERSISTPFWDAFDREEKKVFAVQEKMREELRNMAHELWPGTRS